MADANCAGHVSQNRVESVSSWTRPEKGESAGKRRKRHVNIPTVKSKICIIHVRGHSSEECEVLGGFGTKYDKIRPTKYHGNSLLHRGKNNRHQKTTPLLTMQWMILY